MSASCLPTGTLTRDFKHLNVDMFLFEEEGKKFLKVECHFGKRKNIAAIRTASSHVQVPISMPFSHCIEARMANSEEQPNGEWAPRNHGFQLDVRMPDLCSFLTLYRNPGTQAGRSWQHFGA